MSKAKIEMKTKFTWTFSVTVDEIWVEDGFNPDADRIHDMVASDLGYACGHEIQVKLIKDANQAAVAKAQGYRSVKAMKKDNGKRTRSA